MTKQELQKRLSGTVKRFWAMARLASSAQEENARLRQEIVDMGAALAEMRARDTGPR